MKAETFDRFWRKERRHLVRLLKELKKRIDDDMIAEDDDRPSIQITLSVNEECSSWSYQTGDNSFTGSCYGDPYWGVGYLYRRDNTEQVAKDLISDLANAIEFE